MLSPAVTKKDRTLETLAIRIFQLEVSKGHLKWKVTELESKSKVSRTLIYRYLGSTKTEILKSAIGIFTSHFYGLNREIGPSSFSERVKTARAFLAEVPESVIFYTKWHDKDHWVSAELKKAETLFQRNLAKGYPKLTRENVLIIHGCLHGLVTAPFLTAAQAAEGGRLIEQLLVSRA